MIGAVGFALLFSIPPTRSNGTNGTVALNSLIGLSGFSGRYRFTGLKRLLRLTFELTGQSSDRERKAEKSCELLDDSWSMLDQSTHLQDPSQNASISRTSSCVGPITGVPF